MSREKGRESLDEMVRKGNDGDNETAEEHSLNNIPSAEENTINQPITTNHEEDENQENKKEEIIGKIGLTNLTTWFNQYVKILDQISGVRGVRPDIKGVDPNKNLIITVLNEDKEREVWSFRKSDELPVLDLEPSKMRVFENNTFEIDYEFNDLFIKTYNLKNKLVIVPSHIYSGLVVPYNKFKVKFNNSEIPIPGFDKEIINRILEQSPDLDYIKVKYPQIKKVKDNINTNYDVINYLNKKQNEVYDMNHIIQLDDVISGIINLKERT